MADPNLSYIVSVTSSQGASAASMTVTAYNRTTGEKLTDTFNADGLVLFDLAMLTSGYTVGDVIEIKVIGKIEGISTHTVSADGSGDVSLTTGAVSTSLPDVSL